MQSTAAGTNQNITVTTQVTQLSTNDGSELDRPLLSHSVFTAKNDIMTVDR